MTRVRRGSQLPHYDVKSYLITTWLLSTLKKCKDAVFCPKSLREK